VLPRPLAPTVVTALRVQRIEAKPPAIAPPAPARPSEPRKSSPPSAAKPAVRRAKPARAEAPARPASEAIPGETAPTKPTRIEAGGDLGVKRRATPDRIDSENPYQ
jgi:hypothetical protein